MKIRGTTSNDLNFDKCYPDHDLEHSKGFSHRSDTLGNANIGSTVICKPYNSKNNENELECFGKLSK